MLEQKNVTVKVSSSFQTICPFPVGYIYQSYNSTSPSDIYGGSWTPITGRFLYCNNGTSVGGSNTHKISIDEMPRHTHDIYSGIVKEDGTVDIYWEGNSRAARSPSITWNSISHGEDKGGMCHYTGNSKEYNTMPAYQSCYAWRRTA